jgi:tetratricopeptide (TPR) repeat protein/transcriptional regulator with XRE-family HTH domain
MTLVSPPSTTAAHAFGIALKRARRAARLTQAELAERAGFSVVYISMLERGARAPQRTTIALLADALDLSDAERNALESVAQPPDAMRRRSDGESAETPHLPVGGFLGALPTGQVVGRERELAVIEDALTAVASGQGRLLTLIGEPGVGKTRLAQALMIRARARGFRVFTGRCYEPQQTVAYYPFLEALAMAAAGAEDLLQAHLAERWPEVARLLPDRGRDAAHDRLTNAPTARDDPNAQQRLFWQVTSFLGTLAEQTPLTLLLDDLHWADRASLDLLQHLARHTRDQPILLVGTAREVEARSQYPLVDTLSDLRRDELVQRLGVRPLGAEDTAELIGATLGGADGEAGTATNVSAEMAQRIYARSEGNPFFARQLTRALQEQDGLEFAVGQWRLRAETSATLPAPESITAVIGQRLRQLTSLGQEVLREASVLGQAFAFGELRRVSGRGEQEVEEALEEALELGVLREGQRDQYHFNHALTLETVYTGLSSLRKRRLHRQTADALEQQPNHERRVGELAYHLLAADERERALPYALLAGDQAEAVYAHAEAEGHYLTALELARELGEQAREAEALEKLGRAIDSLSRPADALDTRERAARAYEALGDAEGELRVLAALAWRQQGHTIERAEAALARILPRLAALESAVAQTGLPSPALALATLYVSTLHMTAGRLHDAVALVERGVELARAARDDAVLVHAYMGRGYVGLLSGSEGSLADLLDALALAERADSDDLAGALNFIKRWYLHEGAFARAKQYAERALAVAERRQVPADIAFMRFNVGELAFYGGDWDEARERFSQAAALQERPDPTFTWGILAPAQVYVCLLDLAQGGVADESIRRLESLLALANMREWVNHEFLLTSALGEVALAERYLLRNHADAARLAAFLDRPGMAEHPRMAPARVIALPALAWAEAELGHDAEAAARLEQAIALATARRLRLWLVDALRVKGLLAARQRRWEDARAALDEAVTMSHGMPYPYAEAKALYVYGQLHRAMGEPQQACEKYEQALLICDRLGERLYRNYIEHALAGLAADGVPHAGWEERDRSRHGPR